MNVVDLNMLFIPLNVEMFVIMMFKHHNVLSLSETFWIEILMHHSVQRSNSTVLQCIQLLLEILYNYNAWLKVL